MNEQPGSCCFIFDGKVCRRPSPKPCHTNMITGDTYLCDIHTPPYRFWVWKLGGTIFIGESNTNNETCCRPILNGRGVKSNVFRCCEGEWKNGRTEGYATETTSTGRYQGRWMNGKYYGYGVLTSRLSNLKVSGCWHNGVVADPAVLHFPNGSRIDGRVEYCELTISYIFSGVYTTSSNKIHITHPLHKSELLLPHTIIDTTLVPTKFVVTVIRALSKHIPVDDVADIVVSYISV